MRSFMSFVLTAAFILVIMNGCDAFSSDESGTVTLTGTVINSVTRTGVEGVFVRAFPSDGGEETITETDRNGAYSLDIDIDSTQNVSIGFTKSGFISTNAVELAVANRTIEVAPVLLVPEDDNADPRDPSGRVSGRASNILLQSQSSSSIGVRESGSTEVAELVFVVTDSLGVPITLNNQITVNFQFGVDPGDGAFISPDSELTDASGQVRTNVSSGTTSGVIQVIAEATVSGKTIRSKPVALAIHGGLPQVDHFGVAPAVFNVARAWDVWGVEATVTAFVGDRFANPVRVGTSVYFTATAGIIEGSSTTGADGRAPVQIISAPPQPNHPQFGFGYVTVTGSTADLNDTQISDDTIILFSGSSRVVVPGGQGQLELGRAYEFFVYDQNQNPLAAGTNITVTAEGTNVESFGNNNVLLTDYLFGDHNFEDQGITYGITRFSFGIRQGEEADESGTPVPPEIEGATIRVSSPNGNIERVVLQSGAVLKRDESGELVPAQ